MKKSILIITSLAILVVFGFSFKGGPLKVPNTITICHIPPGNPGNSHEITISLNAFNQHVDHHDDTLVCYNQDEFEFYNQLGAKHNMRVIYME